MRDEFALVASLALIKYCLVHGLDNGGGVGRQEHGLDLAIRWLQDDSGWVRRSIVQKEKNLLFQIVLSAELADPWNKVLRESSTKQLAVHPGLLL